MKTTFDLPDRLLRRAKAKAAHQGRPLREFVAEAIDAQLGREASEITDAPLPTSRRPTWNEWRKRLRRQPDGSWVNPAGVDDETFHESLEAIRREAWPGRDPFAGE